MATSEVRTQIYLPRRLHRALGAAARRRRVSMAQLLREAAEEVLRRDAAERGDPLKDLIGVVDNDATDLSTNHDHYLYGARRRR